MEDYVRDCHLAPPCSSLGKLRRRGTWGPASLTFLALGNSPGPWGTEAAGAERNGVGRGGNGGVVEVGAHTTNVHPCREKGGQA